MESAEVYNALGGLLIYPEHGATTAAARCVAALKGSGSPAIEPVGKFAEHVSQCSEAEIQELFTRTFDINPVAALEVGWHLFGERYERGTFIVKMRQTLRDLEIPESTELPDHLTHVLEALGRMDANDADEFANMFVLPALSKMQEAHKGKENAYTNVLDGISCELKYRHTRSDQGASHE